MIRKTQAAILVETGKPLELWELTVPEPGPGQVLVELAYSGVCHSQLNEARGRKGPDRYVPHCLGHEGSGRVLEVGPGVSKVQPGQEVVLTWIKANGGGPPGVVYGSARGPVNAGAVSTFQQHALVAENRVVLKPEGLSLDVAALLGCAIPTGAGIVLNTLKLRSGQTLAVFGAGGIGLSAVMAARSMGAAQILVVDVLGDKLQTAAALGASATFLSSSESEGSLVQALKAATGGKGVDFAIEATGQISAMQQAFAVTRDGGTCVVAGNPRPGLTLEVDPYDLIRGKKLLGSWGGDSRPDEDLILLSEFIRSGSLPAEKLLSHQYSLDQINEALDALEHGKVTRALIAFSQGGLA